MGKMISLSAFWTRIIFFVGLFGSFLTTDLFPQHPTMYKWVQVICAFALYVNHEITVASNANGTPAKVSDSIKDETK